MNPNASGPADTTTLRACAFSSIMAGAVTMSAAVAHLMEMPAKMRYEPELYVRLHRTLYPTFGKTAGPAEALAVASTAALAWMAQSKGRRSSGLAVVAAGCLATAHGMFWSVVQPANIEMMRSPLNPVPRIGRRHSVTVGVSSRRAYGSLTTALATLTWSVHSPATDAEQYGLVSTMRQPYLNTRDVAPPIQQCPSRPAWSCSARLSRRSAFVSWRAADALWQAIVWSPEADTVDLTIAIERSWNKSSLAARRCLPRLRAKHFRSLDPKLSPSASTAHRS